MPFVKLDCAMLRSTVWYDFGARNVFITALLMAEPRVFDEPQEQIKVGALELTGWQAPPGWYGFVPAASTGIVAAAGMEMAAGLEAMTRLGEPDQESRSKEHDGRRMIRINGGFLVLNYMRYREHDNTAAERSRRYRQRLSATRNATPVTRDKRVVVTQAEAEAEAEQTTEAGSKRARDVDHESGTGGAVGLSSHRPPPPTIDRPQRPANPLLPPERQAADREAALRLVDEIKASALSHGGIELDGAEIFAEASAYRDKDGHERRGLNPASMSAERLALTVSDLRSRLADEQAAADARRVKAITAEREKSERARRATRDAR